MPLHCWQHCEIVEENDSDETFELQVHQKRHYESCHEVQTPEECFHSDFFISLVDQGLSNLLLNAVKSRNLNRQCKSFHQKIGDVELEELPHEIKRFALLIGDQEEEKWAKNCPCFFCIFQNHLVGTYLNLYNACIIVCFFFLNYTKTTCKM